MGAFFQSKLGQLLKGALQAAGSSGLAYLVTNGKDIPEFAAYFVAFNSIVELILHLLKKKE